MRAISAKPHTGNTRLRIALVLNDDFSMWQFFRGLIRELKKRQVEVHVVTPTGPYVPLLCSLGAKHWAVRIHRFVHPPSDVMFCLTLVRLFWSQRIDLVCNITIKPNVYGAIAARIARVRSVISMIEGLGYAFTDTSSLRGKLLNRIVSALYWVSCSLSDRVGFANSDDLLLFERQGIVKRRRAVAFRSMIGINLGEYSQEAVNEATARQLRAELSGDESARFVMMVVARVVVSKGVMEFIEASKLLARECPTARFVLIGPLDPGSPDAISRDVLIANLSRNFLWLGFRREVKEFIYLADAVVLPSYYREGVPRVLLEAMALGKPIVTTDNVGCREVIEEGRNGFMIPARDAVALAGAVKILLTDAKLREEYGRNARAKAEAEFDEAQVVDRLLSDLFCLKDGEPKDGLEKEAGVGVPR